jgi:hypothetical protein
MKNLKKTPMQDLREDLVKTIKTSVKALEEIEDKKERFACQSVVSITLQTIIKRIDEELLEKEKQEFINACNQTEFEDIDGMGIHETITKGDEYYEHTFAKAKPVSSKKNKKKVDYQLPTVGGFNVMDSLNEFIPKKENKKNLPPDFKLEIGIPANNIAKQLKKQKIEFDPSVIKRYDKMIKSIINLKTEGMIGKKKSQELIYAFYERSIKHVYFIYEML